MAKTNNTGIVRQLNLDIVRQTLRSEGQMTKATLARKTGMSIATCGNLLQLLVENEEVIEGEINNLTGGRPAKTYFYNGQIDLVLCVYILVEEKVTLRMEVYNSMGKEQDVFESHYDSITIDELYYQIGQVIDRYEMIETICIGVPGAVVDGKIEFCDEPNLANINMVSKLQRKYNKDIVVGSEKYFKVCGYYKRMELKDDVSLVYMLSPKNREMGAGIIVDGHVLRGGNAMAGETMYLPYYKLKKTGIAVDEAIGEMPFIVSSMVAVIAPEYFVLPGSDFSEGSCEELRKACMDIIPENHIPQILYTDDTMKDYSVGMMDIALEKLNGGIKLIST